MEQLLRPNHGLGGPHPNYQRQSQGRGVPSFLMEYSYYISYRGNLLGPYQSFGEAQHKADIKCSYPYTYQFLYAHIKGNKETKQITHIQLAIPPYEIWTKPAWSMNMSIMYENATVQNPHGNTWPKEYREFIWEKWLRTIKDLMLRA